MAGDIASGSDLTVASVTPMEQAVLGEVPADASADQAALDARIAEMAGGQLGVNLSDPRYAVKGAGDDTATGGVAAGGKSGEQAGDGEPDNASGQKVEEATIQPEATPKSGDQGTEQVPPVVPAVVVPKDYSLTIMGGATVDAEGKTVPGKEYKIEKIEDLPEDFVPKNNRQILEIINDLNKLETTRAKDEATSASQAQVAAAQAAQEATLKSWDTEISAMQKSGVLEAPKLKPEDPKYLTDPAMQKIAAVFNFMEKTNIARKAAGNPNLIRSFEDGYEKMDRAERVAKDAQAAKDEAETAKLKASVVGGGTAKAGGATAPVYRAGQAQDMRDML